MTVVLVTHNIDEALILGDQVLAMAGGRVARLGAVIGTHVGPGCAAVVFVAKE